MSSILDLSLFHPIRKKFFGEWKSPKGFSGKPMGIETFQNLSYYAKDALGLQGQISPSTPSPCALFYARTGDFSSKNSHNVKEIKKISFGLDRVLGF